MSELVTVEVKFSDRNELIPTTIQCESYETSGDVFIFYRMRILNPAYYNPNEYWAVYAIPLHRITWVRRPFAPGKPIPNYDSPEYR